MRPLSLLITASVFALSASAGAQTQQPYPPADTAPISTVTVTSPKAVRLMPDELRMIAGTYNMENGWQLEVRGKPQYIDATIDTEKPMRLRAVSKNKFVSGDGNVTMEFNPDTGQDMKMTYVPDPSKPSMVSIPAQRKR